ncbi:MAG: hypothetical protein HZB26_04190 [Candidatus Hydrogenedentes bacterium]|nr:hypothetical protein [Candidatus Hydrogenedentota bacterium]
MGDVLVAACAFLGTLAATGSAVAPDETAVELFDAAALPTNLVQNSATASLAPVGAGHGLRVEFQKADWPNVYFKAPHGVWDWTEYLGIAVDIQNPGTEPVDVCCRVDNEGADGMKACNTGKTTIRPGETQTFSTYFNVASGKSERFWGMRGVPGKVMRSSGPPLDRAKIVAFQYFLPTPQHPQVLVLSNIRVFGKGKALEEIEKLPFVDKYGQYNGADWPGKLKSAHDFKKWSKAEKAALDTTPALAGRDSYGGWADGPTLEATGWFRSQQVNGKWWLVTPDGHLFFSAGMDCVGTSDSTFITGRDGWFASIPKETSKNKALFGQVDGVHSMAEAIDGKGKIFNFYKANLERKYGKDWAAKWRETTVARLQAWGFNTIANWSQQDVADVGKMPFTATAGIGGNFRRVEGGSGYWGRMSDPFDPSFLIAAESSLAPVTEKYGKNPMCIGYFVDNELSWGSANGHAIAEWVLNSPPDQPCRAALVARLKERYPAISDVNRVWATNAPDWDALRAPGNPNAACAKDLDEFIYLFARRYFDTVNAALKRHAPHQLYLGCRFAGPPCKMVTRACAEVADIVSFNLYQRAINAADWTGPNDLGKPLIIGEFHFGALDRGMFHPGLVETKDQNERAASYKLYVESVVDCPAFVGCHWFQYVDEPITGRYFDGENYNIGFVTVVDQPYPEMVSKAKEAHAATYARRYLGTK